MSTTIIVDKEIRQYLSEQAVSTDKVFSQALGIPAETVPYNTTAINIADDTYKQLVIIKRQNHYISLNTSVRYVLGYPPIGATRHPERLYPVRRIPPKTLIYVSAATYSYLVDHWVYPDDVIRKALNLEVRKRARQVIMPMMRYEVSVSLSVRTALHRIRDQRGFKNVAQAADSVFGL